MNILFNLNPPNASLAGNHLLAMPEVLHEPSKSACVKPVPSSGERKLARRM